MHLNVLGRRARSLFVLLAAVVATALVAAVLLTSTPTFASAQATSTGQADDTAGVFLYTAGLDSGQGFVTPPPLDCTGEPGQDPTNVTINTAVTADPAVLYLLGDDASEVLEFTLGDGSSGERAGGVPDATVADVTTGLGSINDYGTVANGGDDDANFDAETGGSVLLQLTIDGQPAFIVPDGVASVGVLGTDPADPFGNLDGAEIFIFEDAELSGYTVELYGPEGLAGPAYSLDVVDYQRNPDTSTGADDTLVAIDLDSLPGFTFPFVSFFRITDDGVVAPTPGFINCPDGGAGDTSLEVDAVATRTDTAVTAFPLIDIEKDTNGDQADTGPGQEIAVGDSVTWTYVVTNEGTQDLAEVTVVDDQAVAIDCGEGTATIALLGVGATVTCTGTGVAVAGEYVNNATATGQPLDALGAPVGEPISDTDRSAYTGVITDAPGLDVEKDTNGDQADTGPGTELEVGSAVTWTYVVANTGNVDLTGVELVDDQAVAITCPSGNPIPTLAVGASETCTGTGVAVEGAYENTVTATGTDPSGTPVDDTDRSAYTGVPQLASLGDFIFVDADEDGLQAGEAGLAGAVVTLWSADASGAPVAPVAGVPTQTTGADGGYLFADLPPNQSYAVQVQVPAGFVFTTADAGDDAADSDANADGIIAGVSLAPGETNLSLDAGVIAPNPSVDVEKDTNGDQADTGAGPEIVEGQPVTWTYVATNTGNVPLANVVITDTVEGEICVIDALAVGASGTCTKTGVAGATPYSNTADVVGQPVDPATGQPFGDPVTDDDPSAYVGLGLATIGDFIFIDADEDGLQAGETGFAGAVVTLWSADADGTPIAPIAGETQTTGADGAYLFDGLAPNLSYAVQVELPAGHVFTTADAGDDAADSDANADGIIAGVLVGPSEENLTLDAGVIVPNPSVDVEKDTNGDQADSGPGEEIVVGEAVTWTYVTTNTGNVDLANVEVVDSVEGAVCTIDSLAVGASETCSLEGVATAGAYTNTANATGQPIDPTTGEPFGPPVEDEDVSAYTGLPLATLGDFIFEDSNGNGIQDDGEVGVAGVTVTLWSANEDGSPDTVLDSQTTGDDGLYLFSDLTPNVGYVVQVSDLPPGYTVTDMDQGDDDAVDSDLASTGLLPAVTPGPGDENLTLDAGLVPPAALGDFVWFDENSDGIQGDDEPGIADVTVNLFQVVDGVDTLAGTTTTGADGFYTFANLDPNEQYRVQVIAPRGAVVTIGDAGDDDNVDSDINALTGLTPILTLAPGQNDLSLDAGVAPAPVSLGDLVWFDENSNSVQDDGEPGIDGVTVNLWSVNEDGTPNEILDTRVTDENGLYLFENLDSSIPYIVEFDIEDVYTFTERDGGPDEADSDPAVENGFTGIIDLRDDRGAEERTIDSGVLPLVAAIEVVKTTSAATFTVGDPVTWTYVVTNTGNVGLTSVPVVDDIEGPICEIAALAVGESETCIKNGIAVRGLYENTATATGTPDTPNPDGSTVSPPVATDDSEYEGTEVLPTTLPTATAVPVPTATPVPPTPTPVPAVPLAVTGSSSSSMALVATSMLLAGALFVVAGRRRRTGLEPIDTQA